MVKLMIRGTHPYSFRTGQWARILDTQLLQITATFKREVYSVQYSDGKLDSIPVDDSNNYEIRADDR